MIEWMQISNPQKSPGLWTKPPKTLGLKIPPPPSQLPLFCLLIGQKNTKFSGTNQKAERRRPFGTGLVRHCPQGLFSLFFTFLCAIFFRPFRLSFAPTICPWVSEDGSECGTRNNLSLYSKPFPHANLWRQNNFWTFDLPIWMWGFFQIFSSFWTVSKWWKILLKLLLQSCSDLVFCLWTCNCEILLRNKYAYTFGRHPIHHQNRVWARSIKGYKFTNLST